MGVTAFPVVSGAQIVAGGDTTAKMEPGTILAYRNSDQWSLVQYIQLDNNGVSNGEALVTNFATLKQYSVKKSATSDRGGPISGVAAATIASQKFGYMYIGGYIEKADLSLTAASGEYIMISGSTAGKLTTAAASVFNSGTQGSASMFMIVGIARTAFATGLGSVSLRGIWGV